MEIILRNVQLSQTMAGPVAVALERAHLVHIARVAPFAVLLVRRGAGHVNLIIRLTGPAVARNRLALPIQLHAPVAAT